MQLVDLTHARCSCVFSFLEELVPRMNFVGMDVVEVSPPYDHAQLTSQVGMSCVELC